MSEYEAWIWGTTNAICYSDVKESVCQTFTYLTRAYLTPAGIKCETHGHKISFSGDGGAIILDITKWLYVVYGGACIAQYNPVKQPRNDLLGELEKIRHENNEVKAAVKQLPQPIAEEIAQEISFYWRLEDIFPL
jgi:hypothetical protein